jgi:hypothetical protein
VVRVAKKEKVVLYNNPPVGIARKNLRIRVAYHGKVAKTHPSQGNKRNGL